MTLVKVESLEHRLVWTSRWSASIPRAPGHWLGSIGTNQTGAKSLGVLGAQCAAPVAKDKSDKRPASQIPSHEKKSFAWVKTLRECVAIGGQMPATKIVCVMDREADFFELFDEQRKTGKVDLLVRA